ncbi:hypothetical protein ACFY4C_40500 [Actinomadura viridis]|uniref:hypothetical protein n=1 Tax=Actinomadura viridis TaxID=58110 RepID=UPI00369E2557
MPLIAMVSAGGAPGTTTAALALTLASSTPALMAECDPDGGSVLAGLFAGHFSADRGLLKVAVRISEDRVRADDVLREQTLPLDEAGERLVLPGPADPFQAQAITPAAWEQIARLLAGQPLEVIADVGQVRAVGYPFPVLAAARLVVFVLRPTLRQVVAARPRLEAIRHALGDDTPLGLCVIGRGPHSISEIRGALGDRFQVVVQLPHDERAAGRLSDGTVRRRDIRTSDLMVQARSSARALQAAINQAPARWAYEQPSVMASARGEQWA